VHWAPNAAAPAGNITWHFEYSAANTTAAFSAPVTVSSTSVMPATQYEHRITETPTSVLGGGAIEVGAVVHLRVYRDAAAASDTSTDSAFVFYIDMNVQVWKHATRRRNKLETGDFYN
jgi:hypothetical protein